ncbi:hypothetical protein KAW18_18825 [candidate division WOR-3 bacterium]|nr:hypothetical protein [candidate division WOR-3 bacterium]
MIDEKIIEDGFWISNKNCKGGFGVKIFPVYDEEQNEITSIDIRIINHNKGDRVEEEIPISKNEFERLIRFVDLLKKGNKK